MCPKVAKNSSFVIVAQLVEQGMLPIFNPSGVSESTAALMKKHGRACRNSGEQRHPLVFEFATKLGLNTDNWGITEIILLMHGVEIKIPKGPSHEKVEYCNSVLEKYLEHRQREWAHRGVNSAVWPLWMCGENVAPVVNEARAGVLSKMQQRLRRNVAAGENATCCISSCIRATLPYSTFARIVGVHQLDMSGEDHRGTVTVHYKDASGMDGFFPPTAGDCASDDSETERWYVHRWSTGGSQYKRVVEYNPDAEMEQEEEVEEDMLVSVSAKYSLISNEFWVVGSWVNYRKDIGFAEWQKLS
jgi:hypothetical protein